MVARGRRHPTRAVRPRGARIRWHCHGHLRTRRDRHGVRNRLHVLRGALSGGRRRRTAAALRGALSGGRRRRTAVPSATRLHDIRGPPLSEVSEGRRRRTAAALGPSSGGWEALQARRDLPGSSHGRVSLQPPAAGEEVQERQPMPGSIQRQVSLRPPGGLDEALQARHRLLGSGGRKLPPHPPWGGRLRHDGSRGRLLGRCRGRRGSRNIAQSNEHGQPSCDLRW